MFSGIIENKGFVFKFEKQKDFRLVLDTNLKYKDIKKGSSVCCNGICLTVISKKKKKNTLSSHLMFLKRQSTVQTSM